MFAMQTDTYSDTNCLFETLSQAKRHKPSLIITSLTVLTRVGHAYAEYANDADYAHMRNMRMRMRIENLIHIIHIWIFAKNGNF